MKLFILSFLFLFPVFAGEITPLEKGDRHLSTANAEIVSIKEICPSVPGRVRCMAYGSVVKVKVTMTGCLDRMGGYFHDFTVSEGKGILSFGAINIFNKASMTARCVRMPTETLTLNVPFEGDIEMRAMELLK